MALHGLQKMKFVLSLSHFVYDIINLKEFQGAGDIQLAEFQGASDIQLAENLPHTYETVCSIPNTNTYKQAKAKRGWRERWLSH